MVYSQYHVTNIHFSNIHFLIALIINSNIGNFYLKNNTEFSQVETLLKETYELSIEALGEDGMSNFNIEYDIGLQVVLLL